MSQKPRPREENYSVESRLIYGKSVSKRWDFERHVIPPISASTNFRFRTVEEGATAFADFASRAAGEDTREFRKKIVRLIRMYRPRIVVTSDPHRRYLWHRDHRIAGQVTLDAVFPYARDHLAYPDLLEEGLEPHNVEEILFWAAEDINYRSDITDTFDLKIAALRCHESQVVGFPNPNPEDWLRERCREMAGDEDFELAEGFHRVQIAW